MPTSKQNTKNRPKRTATRTKSSPKTTSKSVSVPSVPDKDPMWIRIWSYSWGKIFYLILAILVVIGLDLLIAMNKYDLFFMILGVEIIIGMLVGWVVFLILDRRKRFADSDEN